MIDEQYPDISEIMGDREGIHKSICASASVQLASNLVSRGVPNDEIREKDEELEALVASMAWEFSELISIVIGYASSTSIMVSSAVLAGLISEAVAERMFGAEYPKEETHEGLFAEDIDPSEFN